MRSPGLTAPCPRPGPRPGQARAGRGDSGPGRALPSRPRCPPPTSPPAPPPFRPAAARRLRPRPALGLGRRGPSHCDTAAPGRACAADSPRPWRRRHSPAFPGCLNGSGDVSTWSLGPAPVKSPSRQGLAASLSRRGCPAWSCVRHGSRLLLLPARPPALLPPPPPPAPRNLRPLAFPPRPPGLTGYGSRWGEAGGGGPERTAIGVRGGGTGKPSPPSPHQPAAREGPGNLPPAVAAAPGPPAPPRTRSRGCSLPESPRPLAPNPGALPGRAQRILLQVLQPPSPSGRL